MPYSRDTAPQPEVASELPGLSPALTFLFAFACGAMVGNIYYAQALIGLISDDLNLHGGMAGFIVTVTQLGYGAGLLLLVSLADLFENRRLVLLTLGGTALGLAGAALSNSAATFLIPPSPSASLPAGRRFWCLSPRIWFPPHRAARRSAMSWRVC